MGDRYPKVRVGVVQAAPVFLNREATVEKAVGFIQDAARKDVQLLAFPEGFIPAHPVWYHFHAATGKKSLMLATELFKNSVEVPSLVTDIICEAAAKAKMHVVMGICEKRPRTTGTMFNTQLFIGPDGRILGKHQKIMPTFAERLVHTGGYADGLRVIDTEVGRLSGLICGENSNPLAMFALAAQSTQIHIASWPQHFGMNEHCMVDAATFQTRALSYKCSCFVLNACGTISNEEKEMLADTEEIRTFLSDPGKGGGSSIIGANSLILAGPMSGAEEGILVKDIDLEDCVAAKLVHDYSGHYNRPDIFSLTMNCSVPRIFQTKDAGALLPVSAPAEELACEEQLPIGTLTISDKP